MSPGLAGAAGSGQGQGLHWRLPVSALAVLSFAAGVIVVTGSLAYDSQGRINVVVLLLLWGLLPFLGSLGALLWAARGAPIPWLLHVARPGTLPAAVSWRAGSRLQWLWVLFACGMLSGYLGNLLFLDLAFAWSSTLLENPTFIEALVQGVSTPWKTLWPAACPSAEVIALTRFERVDPASAAGDAGQAWWPFLLMVLLVYNLLPRVLLGVSFSLVARGLVRRGAATDIRVSPATCEEGSPAGAARILEERSWRGFAPECRVYWGNVDLPPGAFRPALSLGHGRWQDESAQLRKHARAWRDLAWVVDGHQVPVADLADLIRVARDAGVRRQALWVRALTTGSHYEASWRDFAREHALVWLQNGPEDLA